MKRLFKVGMLLTVALISACGGGSASDGNEEKSENTDTGSITLSVTDGVATRVIAPTWTEVKKYDIYGTGPDGATFEVLEHHVNSGDVEVNEIASGEWTIQVVAWDTWYRDQLGSGETSVTVTRGSVTAASVEVEPDTEPGTLSLMFSWGSGYVSSPNVEVDLVDAQNVITPLSLTVNGEGTSASYSGSQDPGYYIMNVRLFDGAELVSGYTEVVRIMTGLTSQGGHYFDQVLEPIGDLALSFIQNMNEEIEVTISSLDFSLRAGESTTIDSELDETLAAPMYRWYRNGQLIPEATGASYLLSSDQNQVDYVTLVVSNGSGTRFGDDILRIATSDQKFAMTDSFGSGWARESIQVDMDLDGDLDVVMAGLNGARSIFYNVGGTFSEMNSEFVLRSWSVDSTDLNNDGRPDLMFATYNSDREVKIFYNQLDGSDVILVDSGITFDIGSEYRGSTFADLDGDGDQDVILTGVAMGVVFFINNGDATFTQSAQTFHAGAYTSTTEFADLNGDGHNDIVVASHGVLLNDGAGNFTEQPALNLGANAVAVTDLDSDGDLDLVSSSGKVLLNDGAASFTESWQAPFHGVDVSTMDVNSDGLPDVLIGTQFAGSNLYINRGDGTFSYSLIKFEGREHFTVELGDFDSDGVADAVLGNRYSDLIQVFKGL